jgi:hypothetical protein
MGKTCFLQRLVHECDHQQPRVPVVLLDFDQRRSGLTDFLTIVRAARRCLGDDRTPAICACEDAICRPAPAVNIQTGAGDGGVDWGRGGRFSDTDIADITARDRVNVQTGDIHGVPPTADPIAWQKAETGRALRSDLARLAEEHRRVVLLVDTFEHAPGDTCVWLERWLLEPMRHDDLSHLILVVAGRPECQEFFAQPRLWSGLVAPIQFDPLSDDDIRAHLRQRGLPVSETELPTLLDLARPSPAAMARVGDLLEQARGGAR